MWVTWKNTAVDLAGTIDGTTELTVELDLRLYAAGVDSGSGDAIDATAGATHYMTYYLQFMNPYTSATGTNSSMDQFLYDAVIGYIEITTTTGTSPAFD